MNRLGTLVRRLIVLSPLIASGCDSVVFTPLEVGQLSVTPRALDLAVGSTASLSALATDANGNPLPSRFVTWSSSDPQVAAVDANGQVVGLSVGVAAVTASAAGAVASAAVTVRSPALLSLSESSVQFRYLVGDSDPTPANIRIEDTNGVAPGLTAQIVHDAGEPFGWLTADLASTQSPTTLVVRVRAAGLPLGRFGAQIRIGAATAANPVVLKVELTVADPRPSITLDPDSVRLSAGSSATVLVQNGGGGGLGTLQAGVRYIGGGSQGWLRAALSASTAPAVLTLEPLTASLAPGTYEARVDVTSTILGVPPAVLIVVLDVGNASPSLVLSPLAVQLGAATAGSATATVQVRNGGSGVLGGLTKGVSYAPGQPAGWLTATLNSTTAPTSLSLVASANGLAVGTYRSSVEVGGGGVTPVLLPVTFVVGPAAPTTPLAPTALSATPSSGSVDLVWTDNSTNESTFEVERSSGGASFTAIGSTATDVARFTDSTAQPGTTYNYRVRACNAAGCSGYSNVASATTAGVAPAAPSALQATVVNSSVDLVWTDNSTNESTFEVERSSSGSSFTAIGSTATDVTTFSDATVQAGLTYDYRVRACNNGGCSLHSNVATATVLGLTPTVPTNVNAVALSAIDVDVSWADVTGETEYEVAQSNSGGSGFQPIAKPAANATSLRVSNLTPGVNYQYQVRACNASGCSGWSSITQVRTPSPKKAPKDPSSLQFVSISPAQIVLRWKDNSGDETRFEIEEGNLFSSWIKIGEVGVNETTFTDTQVARGFLIQYRILACNPAGCSSPSPAVNTVVP